MNETCKEMFPYYWDDHDIFDEFFEEYMLDHPGDDPEEAYAYLTEQIDFAGDNYIKDLYADFIERRIAEDIVANAERLYEQMRDDQLIGG